MICKSRFAIAAILLTCANLALAKSFACPPMPAAVTEINRDFKADLNVSLGAIGKLKVGQIGTAVAVTANNLYSKYPNVDRLVVIQTMSSTYCEILRASEDVGSLEKIQRWDTFQREVIKSVQKDATSRSDTPTAPGPIKKSAAPKVTPPKSHNADGITDKAISVVGNSNTTIVGSGNTVSNQTYQSEASGLGTFKYQPLILEGSDRKGQINYFRLVPDVSSVRVDRINKSILAQAKNISDRFQSYRNVVASIKPKFLEFGLIGATVDIVAEWEMGPHPLEISTGFVLNIENGSAFELKDLFRSGYTKTLNPIVIEQLTRQGSYSSCDHRRGDPRTGDKSKSESYVEHMMEIGLGYVPKACFISVNDDTNFFLTSTTIVLKFSRYEVAIGAAGSVEVSIELEQVKSIINPNGPLSKLL